MPVRFLLLLLVLALPAAAQPAAQPLASVSPELAELLLHVHSEMCERHVTFEGGRPVLWHTLLAKDSTANTIVDESRLLSGLGPLLDKQAQQSATFQVRYSSNFPTAARASFSFAANIWATHVTSNAPIVIDAEWASLGERVLGSAGTTFLFRDEPFLPRGATWYPAALAESLARRSLTGADADVTARFNSEFPNWYFGTDRNTPASDYNFATVVLHEIGHGLGFFDSFSYDDGDSSNGAECNGQVGIGCFGLAANDGSSSPVIFDRFLKDRSERALLTFDTNSAALGNALQSRGVFFDGFALRSANDELPVQLFAPSNFEAGSSIAHLDETIFPAGTPNSLMTPQLARQETIYSPGSFTCAIFADIGWRLGADCELLLSRLLTSFSAIANGCTVELDFQIAISDVARVVVERSLDQGPFQDVFAADSPTTTSVLRFADPGLAPGSYRYRLRLVQNDGSVETSGSTTVEAQIAQPTFSVSNDDVSIGLMVGNCAIDQIVVERRYFGDAFEAVGTIQVADDATATFPDLDLAPGRYFYRFRLIPATGAPTLFTVNEEVEVTTSEDVFAMTTRPNPFTRQATVDLVVRTRQDVDARLYDALGRLISRPFSGSVGSNQRARIVIDGARLGAGVYFLRVKGEEFEIMETLVRAGG